MEFAQADAINRLIRALGMRHRARALELLRDLGLHPGQEILLLQLATQGPCTQIQLANGAGIEPPSVTLMVRKLEKAGLVSRTPSPTDGRATVVELTGAGNELVPRIEKAWRVLAEETTGGHPLALDELMGVLWPMVEALGGVHDPSHCPDTATSAG